jgi:hypothetical protein
MKIAIRVLTIFHKVDSSYNGFKYNGELYLYLNNRGKYIKPRLRFLPSDHYYIVPLPSNRIRIEI